MKKNIFGVVLIAAFILVMTVAVYADIPGRKTQLDWLIYGAGGNDTLGRINAAGEAVARDESVTGQFSYSFTNGDGTISGRVQGVDGEISVRATVGTQQQASDFAMQFARHFATMTRAGHDHSYAPLPENLGGQSPERYPIDFTPRDGNAENLTAANNIRVRDREPSGFIIFMYDSRDDGGMMSSMWMDGTLKLVSDLKPERCTLTPGPDRPVAQATPRPGLRLVVGYRNFTRNGETYQADAAPFIAADGRTMVPLRIVAEGLGAEVEWVAATRTVIITSGGETLRLPVGVPLPDEMGTPVIVRDLTFVPVRYVSQKLGADVHWDELTQAVYIFD